MTVSADRRRTIHWRNAIYANTYIRGYLMLILCIADAERGVGMKNLSRKEAITILESMRVDITLPKAAVTQRKRNTALDMAINALNCSEIPNNSDTISRQRSIDALRKMQTYKLFAGDDMLLIDQAEAQTELMGLPTVQPEQRWIPCSERLPEEGKVVLTQAKFKDDVKMAVSSRIDYNYWTTWGTRDINIVAWMPLPEPARLENGR